MIPTNEQLYDKDQLVLWGQTFENYFRVMDRYAVITPPIDKKLVKTRAEARSLVNELIDKFKKGKYSLLKDPEDVDPLEDVIDRY